MNERESLQKLIKELEMSMDEGPRPWPLRIFSDLSDRIQEKTHENISVKTLQRLFGKADQKNDNYTPHTSTLDILCIYLGYSSWKDFKRKKNPASGKFSYALMLTLFLGILLLIAGYLYFTGNKKTADKKISFQFITTDTISTTSPFTARIGIKINEISDSVFIDWGLKARPRQLLNPGITHLNQIYYNYGYYRIKLTTNTTILKEQGIHLICKDWITFIEKDNIYHNTGIKQDSILSFPTSLLSKFNLHPGNQFYVHYILSDTFRCSMDSMLLAFCVKEHENALIDGLEYTSFKIRLRGEKNDIYFQIRPPGNYFYSKVEVASEHLDGKYDDLSGLDTDLSQWRQIKMHTGYNQLDIFIDDKKTFSHTIREPLGKLKAISFHVRGIAYIKNIILYDHNDSIVYEN